MLKIPDKMTVGMEIESIGPFSVYLKRKGIISDWVCANDGSVEGKKLDESGAEVKSPILTGDVTKSTNSIRNMCDLLNNIGQSINNTCGGHIHIGGNYLTSASAYKNLIELYINTEKNLYIISNKEGELPRDGVLKYAAPMTQFMNDLIEMGDIELDNEDDLEVFKTKLVNVSDLDRCRGINFNNLSGLGTIEFRLANGTLDPDAWIENVNLFGGMVKIAEDISKIQEKNNNEVTNEERNILEKFEKVRSGKLSEKEKMQCLLDLTVCKEDREIYMNRYNTNSKLLMENPQVEDKLNKYLELGNDGFRINKHEVGQGTIGGNNGINGKEMQYIKEKIDKSKMKQNDYDKELE